MNAPRPLPTRRDEDWRYADLGALARLWDDLPPPEPLTLAAGERRVLVIGPDAAPVRRIGADVAAGACLTVHALVAAGDYARLEIDVTLGAAARFDLAGVILAGGGATREIVTRTHHAAPGATSRQTIRMVAADRARASFLGRIEVARGAQATDAAQSVKAMLLDRGATINAKPELEIFADDVKCAHGCAIGEIDPAQLFYMGARGIAPPLAKRLIIHGFIADALAGAPELADAAGTVLEAML